MKASLDLDMASFARVERKILSRLQGGFAAGQVEMGLASQQVADLAERTWPVATGDSQEGVHHLSGSLDGLTFTTGVGVLARPNGQEVRAERGDFEPHRSLDEHEAAGCSTGVHGGWGDEYEQVNVYLERGSYRQNPSAQAQPLGRAAVAVLGAVIDLGQAEFFKRGGRNMYQGIGTTGTRLRSRISRAVLRGIALLLMLAVMTCAPVFAGDGSDYRPMFNDVVIAPGDSVVSAVSEIGFAKYGTLYVAPKDTLDGGANIGLYGYVLTDREKTGTGYQEWWLGAPRWILTEAEAITSPGFWSLQVAFPGASWLTVVLKNAGADSVWLEGGTSNSRNYLWLHP